VHFISIITPTFNEKDNIEKLSFEISNVLKDLNVKYEHIIIDNNSTDGTQDKIIDIASKDKNVKIIINQNNYGHIRSPFHALLQANGDAVILIPSDFQHPVNLIKEYFELWKKNHHKVILGRKINSKENFIKKNLRRLCYRILKKISNDDLPLDCTGDGLYDRSVIEVLRKTNEFKPYLRGLVSSLGYKIEYLDYIQQKRLTGETKNNFFSLFDFAVLGLIKHSSVPMRFVTLFGFFTSIISISCGLFYLVLKILNWNTIEFGIAPILTGFFILTGIQIFFIGLIGEYIVNLQDNIKKHPLVIEKKRINF
jgi:glycosyltransferase involved in cell wall biosynthesis